MKAIDSTKFPKHNSIVNISKNVMDHKISTHEKKMKTVVKSKC